MKTSPLSPRDMEPFDEAPGEVRISIERGRMSAEGEREWYEDGFAGRDASRERVRV